MASDVDIVLEVATKGVDEIYKLSNAMQQLSKVVQGVANPMKALDARSRALSAAVGSADSSLKSHAKTIDQLARNNAVLTNELGRVRKEIAGMGTDFRYATGASSNFRKAAISDLKAYEGALKGIRLRALTEDLKGVAQEQKRLGKDAQFVGRSLIIGLTTPIMGFARYGLQALVGIDKEFVRLNKVLENVAPNLEQASKKMGVDLAGATKEQSKQLQGMVDRYDRLDKSLTKVSNKFGLAKSLTVGLAGDFAELGIQSEESLAKITELTAATEKLGDMDIGAAKDLVQSLYFQAQRSMQMSGQSRNMTFQEREIAAIGAATAQLNLFNSVENVTALTLRDLGDAFPEVAAAGSSFGLSMTELAGMLAPMKAAGFEVGASANSIKVSLQRLVAPTKQNSDLFAQLSKQYNVNFTSIKGTGLDAIQSLIDGFNELKSSTAGQEGAMEFFAKVFGVRQGPRMEVAIAQMAEFDEILKSSNVNMSSAEKRLQGFANQAVASANKSSNANLPVIKSYKDIGIIARIATTQMKDGETRMIDGFGRVTSEQVKAARKVRQAVTEEIVKAQRESGEDIIGQVGTEAGRAMFIELAGSANAAQIAQRELDTALGSLDTQLSILKNNFKSFAADMIKSIKPALEKLSDLSSRLIKAWEGLDGRTKKLVSTVVLGFAGITASIGPLIFVFGQFRLAMGSVAGVLFKFLPGLKTMSVEAVAGRDAMLRLTKPLTVMGDTVVNTNNKFATFIATLASGEGPVGRLANKLGVMTGVLQKQTTAPLALAREVTAQKTARATLTGAAGTIGPLPTPAGAPPVASLSARLKSALKLQKTGVMSGAAGVRGPGGRMMPMDPDQRDILAKVEALMKQSLVGKGYPTMPGGRGPGGRFSKTVEDMVQEAIQLQSRGVTSGAAGVRTASGRFRAMTGGERDSLKTFEETRETLVKRSVAQRALSRKNIDFDIFTDQRSYKGRDISAERASDIYRGGIRGKMAQFSEARARARDAAPDRIKDLGGKVKGLATAPIDGFKKSVAGASTSVMALRAQHAAAGVEAPRFFARMSAAVKGFTKATTLGTQAMKILKFAMISSGIGAILLAVAVGFILIKNNMDKFKEAGSKGLKTVGEAFKTIKNALMEIIRPIVDLFAHFGNGSKGAEGAVEGLGKAFSGIATVFKFVADMFKMVVENFIKPYLYVIINIVAAVVSLFQGNWKKAFSFLMTAVAFAVEFFVNTFALGFKLIVSLTGGLIKGVVSVLGLLGKALIEYAVYPITAVLKAASMLPFGIGNKFKGINDKFRSVVNGAKGMVDSATGAINGTVDKATGAVNGLIDKSAKGIKNKLGGLKKGGIDASTGKVDLGGKKQKPEVDTDPMEEQIANATGDGLEEGAEEGASALAKAIKGVKKEVQEEIANRIKDAMNDVVDRIKQTLKDQKEASLGIYDAQIKKIEDVADAEERLTKQQEYQNKLREAEDQRALNRMNNRRSYAMAVYAGQIDEARAIADAGAQQEKEDTRKIGEINSERSKEIAEQNRKDMIDSIKDAREVASKHFDDMIELFVNSAKKITEFPPTTAEEFNSMLNTLINGGDGFIGAVGIANSIGLKFSESFGGALANLGTDTKGPLSSALSAISTTLVENNPFGPNGLWSVTIDKSIEALTKKYKGLTNTLTTVLDTNSEAFNKLVTVYKNYQALVETTGADGTGTGAGAGGAGGGDGADLTGTGNLPVKKGKVTPRQMAGVMLSGYRSAADRQLILDYLSDAFAKFVSKPNESAKNNFQIFLNENPSLKKSGNARVLTMVTNLYNLGATSKGYNGYKLYEIGGMLPYGKGGPTKGPTQQGIPAILHGGEYVVRNSAVKRYGWGMMDQINRGTYKPKPFANGGMVQGKKGKVQDPAQAEWNWQQQNGGFTEAYMDTIAKGESSTGDNWGKKPDWFGRVLTGKRKDDPKTKDKNEYNPGAWMAGGMRTADATWFDYGGSDFAKTADMATKLQQMVVKNRIAIFGWIRKVQKGDPAYPAGATLMFPPLGTGDHTFNRGVIKTAEKPYKDDPAKLAKFRSKYRYPSNEFPLPENFNENLSYITQSQNDPYKSFGSAKGAFNTVEAKESYLRYFTKKPSGFDKITMPFSKPIWITGRGSQARIVKKPDVQKYGSFDDFASYSPSLFKGGLVGNNKKDKNKTSSPGQFREADAKSVAAYNKMAMQAKMDARLQEMKDSKYNVADQRAALNPFSDLLYKPKNKQGGFLGGLKSLGRGVLDAVKVGTSTFISTISSPGEFALNFASNALGQLGVGKKQSNDSVLKSLFINSIKETSIAQRLIAMKEMLTTGKDARVLMGVDRGWGGLGGFIPMQAGEDAFKEQAKNRNILGKGTTLSPGGLLSYFGLNKGIGGISKAVTGKQADWTKEGSKAYGVTNMAGDILADIAASPGGLKSITKLAKDPVKGAKALPKLFTEEGQLAIKNAYWEKIKTPLQNAKGRFKNYKNDVITAFKPDAVQIPPFTSWIDDTEILPGRSWLQKIKEDAAYNDPYFPKEKSIYQNLTSSPYKNIWQDIAASRPARSPFETIKLAAEQAYWQSRHNLMQKFPKLGKLDENYFSFKEKYKPSYRDGMNNMQNWFEESNIGSDYNRRYPFQNGPPRPGMTTNQFDEPEYRNFIQEWYGERYGRDMGYDTAKSRFDVISTHFKKTGLYNRYNNIKQSILSSNKYPTQATAKFSNLFDQYFKKLPLKAIGNAKGIANNYKGKLFDFLVSDKNFSGFGKGSMELPPWTMQDLMNDMPRLITKDFIDELILPKVIQKERILGNIQNSKLGRTGSYKKAMELFKNQEKLKYILFENPRLRDVFNQNPNLGGIFAKYPELLEAASVDPSIVNILDQLRPSSIKSAIDGNYGIMHGDDPMSTGSHRVQTYRRADSVKNSVQVPLGSSRAIQPTVDFSFYVEDYIDYITSEASKRIRISGLYSLQGIGQTDLFKVLSYVYEKIIKPQGITEIINGSYSKHSYALSQNMGEIMKFMDPNVKIITPNLQDWASGSMNSIDFGSGVGYSRDLGSEEAVSDWLSGKNMLGGGNQIADIADRLRIEKIQADIIKGKMDAKRSGTKFKSGSELLREVKGETKFNGGLISRANGGIIPGFGSQGVPAMLHGGEYVINSSAVKNVGLAALQALNNMRFNTPKAPSYSGPVNGQASSTSTTHIYVENFIGEKQWFESMMKDYNVNVAPQNQRAAGLNNTTISTYSGINRGL